MTVVAVRSSSTSSREAKMVRTGRPNRYKCVALQRPHHHGCFGLEGQPGLKAGRVSTMALASTLRLGHRGKGRAVLCVLLLKATTGRSRDELVCCQPPDCTRTPQPKLCATSLRERGGKRGGQPPALPPVPPPLLVPRPRDAHGVPLQYVRAGMEPLSTAGCGWCPFATACLRTCVL